MATAIHRPLGLQQQHVVVIGVMVEAGKGWSLSLSFSSSLSCRIVATFCQEMVRYKGMSTTANTGVEEDDEEEEDREIWYTHKSMEGQRFKDSKVPPTTRRDDDDDDGRIDEKDCGGNPDAAAL